MAKFFFCILISISSMAYSWDELGHRTVANIAFNHLTQAALSAVQNLLQGENFIDTATWADEVKRLPGWTQTATYHYVSVGDGANYFQTLSSLPALEQDKGDVIMAIMKGILILRDPRSDLKSKNWALKFLIHFVGDLHQPMHTGLREDHGGNSLPVLWFTQRLNLHALWDGAIVQTAYGKQLQRLTLKEQDRWFATFLMNKYPQASRLVIDLDIYSWLATTMAVRPIAYKGYDGNNIAYLKQVLPYLEAQIIRGGLDLACLLNTIFANPNQLSPKEIQLINGLDAALKRSFLPIIQLTPVMSPRSGFFN